MPSLLALVAHPDDESYSFAGTIALAARAGWRCVVHCASSGGAGQRHDGGPPGALALARDREAELRASCALLGTELPVFWGLPDGAFRMHAGEAARIGRLLDSLAPDLVFSLGPDGAYGHPDHIALYGWLLEAWGARMDPPPLLLAAFPRGLFLPQYERCLRMMGDPPSPAVDEIGSDSWDYEVDIRGVAATKRAAIAAHRTQLPRSEPDALFPPGIVEQLMAVERFVDGSGRRDVAMAEALASFGAPVG